MSVSVFNSHKRQTLRRDVAEQLEFFLSKALRRGITCQFDERGFCRGCMRSRDERFNWQK